MKIVILGAGASYDCINRFHDKDHDAHKWRPPLGNDIFGARVNFREIYDKYPGALSLSHSINAGNDIEDFFQNKWELAVDKNDKHTLANIINTQYCLQELFYKISIEYSKNIGSSNYHRSEEHTSELQSRPHLVCRLLLEKKNKTEMKNTTRSPASHPASRPTTAQGERSYNAEPKKRTECTNGDESLIQYQLATTSPVSTP